MIFRLAFLTVFAFILVGCGKETGTITANLVNLRSGPSTDSAVVATLNANERVEIIDKLLMDIDQSDKTPIGKSGILNKQTQISVNYFDSRPMNYGKAVKIVGIEAHYYVVEFELQGKNSYGRVRIEDVEILKVNTWYKVRTATGQEGWVFDRFIVKS